MRTELRAPPTERDTAGATFRPMCIVTKRSPISATADLLSTNTCHHNYTLFLLQVFTGAFLLSIPALVFSFPLISSVPCSRLSRLASAFERMQIQRVISCRWPVVSYTDLFVNHKSATATHYSVRRIPLFVRRCLHHCESTSTTTRFTTAKSQIPFRYPGRRHV